MWIDQHPYVFIYLIGCALTAVLAIFNMTLFWFIAWFTRGNVAAKNLKKLQPPEEVSRSMQLLIYSAMFLFEIALSWIGVIAAIWKLLSTLLSVVREAISSAPEAIRSIRFALRNNPNMAREVVWAYVQALRIRLGEMQPQEDQLLGSLDALRSDYPSINGALALGQLSTLDVVSRDVIASATKRVLLVVGEEGE